MCVISCILLKRPNNSIATCYLVLKTKKIVASSRIDGVPFVRVRMSHNFERARHSPGTLLASNKWNAYSRTFCALWDVWSNRDMFEVKNLELNWLRNQDMVRICYALYEEDCGFIIQIRKGRSFINFSVYCDAEAIGELFAKYFFIFGASCSSGILSSATVTWYYWMLTSSSKTKRYIIGLLDIGMRVGDQMRHTIALGVADSLFCSALRSRIRLVAICIASTVRIDYLFPWAISGLCCLSIPRSVFPVCIVDRY